MSVADKFKGQKQKLENLCEERHYSYKLDLNAPVMALTLRPLQGMYEQLSMLEAAEDGEDRISPDAYMQFWEKEGVYGTTSSGKFPMDDSQRKKIMTIFTKLNIFYCQFFRTECIGMQAVRKGLMPEIEEDGEGEGEESKSTDVAAEDLDSGEFEEDDEGPNDGEEDDSLIRQATFIVRNENACSTALLQRRLKLGYVKALHLVNLLEQRGIVGPYQGGGSREVLPYDQPEDEEVSADARATGT